MHQWFRNWGGAPVAQFQYWLEECKCFLSFILLEFCQSNLEFMMRYF